MNEPCECGSEWYIIQATFDEDGNISFYDLDAQCNNCIKERKAPCPEPPRPHLRIVK